MDRKLEPIHIVLADDDHDDRFFFSTALEEVNLKTSLKLIADGVELMDYLNNTFTDLPEILFLDMNMPRKSGLECLTEIRKNRNYDTICIVIYSTFDTKEQIEEILDAGANIYFNKPDELSKIKEMIQKVMRIYRFYPDLGANEDAFNYN